MAVLKRWLMYASNQRKWEDQAKELFQALNGILDPPEAKAALKKKEEKKQNAKQISDIKGVTMADVKV